MKYNPAWANMHAAMNAHSAQSPASQPQQSPAVPTPPPSNDGLVATADAQGRRFHAQALRGCCWVESTEPTEQQLSSCRALQAAVKIRRCGGVCLNEDSQGGSCVPYPGLQTRISHGYVPLSPSGKQISRAFSLARPFPRPLSPPTHAPASTGEAAAEEACTCTAAMTTRFRAH